MEVCIQVILICFFDFGVILSVEVLQYGLAMKVDDWSDVKIWKPLGCVVAKRNLNPECLPKTNG